MTTTLIRGTRFLITYDTGDYLDKERLSVFFNELYPVRELYINFHLGVTRAAVWFKKQFTIIYNDVFNFDGNFPTIENIKGKDRDVWLRTISDFAPSDKMTTFFQELDQKEEL